MDDPTLKAMPYLSDLPRRLCHASPSPSPLSAATPTSDFKFGRDSHLCDHNSRWLGMTPFTNQAVGASLVAEVTMGGFSYKCCRNL